MKGITKEDAILVFVSLLIAIALWINVTISRQETTAEKQVLGVGVRIANLQDKYDLFYKPSTVNVLIRGIPRALSKINMEDVTVSIDLTGLPVGQWGVTPKVTIADEQGISEIKTTPERIEVTLKNHEPRLESTSPPAVPKKGK